MENGLEEGVARPAVAGGGRIGDAGQGTERRSRWPGRTQKGSPSRKGLVGGVPMSLAVFPTAFRGFVFRHGDLGVFGRGSRSEPGMAGWVAEKELFWRDFYHPLKRCQ